MPKNVDEVIRAFSPRRHKKIEARAAELLTEEMTLRELRTAHQKTQVSMAAALGIAQESVSRIEKRSDLMLSTLRGYVAAMGGDLELVATFPDRRPVVLRGFAAMEGEKPKSRKAAVRRRQQNAGPSRSKRQHRDTTSV